MSEKHHHVCPVWVGYLLLSPLRQFAHDPNRILGPYVKPGMHVMDIGCAMGFFTIPMAHLVDRDGHVTCIDLQQKMLDACLKRARRKKLDDRITTRLCKKDSLDIADLANTVDFALAFAVVHEVPDASSFFSEVFTALKPGRRMLVAEPAKRVPNVEFEKSIKAAKACGFTVAETLKIPKSRATVLQKN